MSATNRGEVMGIRSTRYICREDAIDRIKEVATLMVNCDYRAVEEKAGCGAGEEGGVDLRRQVDNFKPIDIDNLDKWTDRMLEDQMDEPYFRFSYFDNYCIGEEDRWYMM